MGTTELRDGADGAFGRDEPEVLALAPQPVPRRLVVTLLGLALALALAVAGFLVWRALQPPPDFTLAQLQGAYTGMVRSDGTNDVSTIGPQNFDEEPLEVSPAACTPLFATTVSNQFPVGAVDGVSTYWLDGGSSVSLFTVRYPDTAAARRAYAEVATAAAGCADRQVSLSGDQGVGVVRPVTVPRTEQAPDQVAFLLDRSAGEGRYALHVLRLSNSVTWQYRYQAPQRVLPAGSSAAVGSYDPLPAQQLMDGMARQLLSIQAADAHR